MTAGVYNISNLEQGATWTMTLAVQTSSSTPIDLTGYTGKMQFREMPGGPVLAEFSTDLGSMTISGSDGLITINAAASVTSSFTFDRAMYDLKVQTGSTVQRLLTGDVSLVKQITI